MFIAESASEKCFKIGEYFCLAHVVNLATTLLKVEENTRHNQPFCQ